MMENNSSQDNNEPNFTQDMPTPRLQVVNGEAKKSSGKGKKILMSLAGLVLIVGLGATGYLYAEEKTENTQLNSNVSSLESENNQLKTENEQLQNASTEEATKIASVPEGYKEYVDTVNGYKFNYSDDWKDFKPEVAVAKDFRLEQLFDRPTLKYDTVAKSWVVDANGSNENPVGSFYTTGIARKDKDLTIYTFSFADGGCGSTDYYFITGKNMISIDAPTACSKEFSRPGVLDLDLVQKQAEELVFSTELI